MIGEEYKVLGKRRPGDGLLPTELFFELEFLLPFRTSKSRIPFLYSLPSLRVQPRP